MIKLLLLLLPLELKPTVGFGLSNNVLPFFPICHQLSPSSHSQHLKISYMIKLWNQFIWFGIWMNDESVSQEELKFLSIAETEGKRSPMRLNHKWTDNINIHFKEKWWEVMDSTLLFQNMGEGRLCESHIFPHPGRIACCPAPDRRPPATKTLHTICGNDTNIVSSSWWWAYKRPKYVEQIISAINHSVASSWFSSLRLYCDARGNVHQI